MNAPLAASSTLTVGGSHARRFDVYLRAASQQPGQRGLRHPCQAGTPSVAPSASLRRVRQVLTCKRAGKWQALLEVPDTDNGGGKYQQVKLLEKRPALSEMRELLAEELQLGDTAVRVLVCEPCGAVRMHLSPVAWSTVGRFMVSSA
jgi:hypothetical protein